MESIDYYIRKVKEDNIYGGELGTKAYPFKEDGVILVKKKEEYFEELKKRIKKCKNLGINIPEYFDYRITDNSEYWILEELAPGEEFENLVDNGNGQNIVNDIPYDHIEKYINDSYLLGINGIGVETRRRNICYDKVKGFTTIDVALCDTNEEVDSLESVAYFFAMHSKMILVEFTEDEKGRNIRRKTWMNMIKAFENGHPYFKKYSRWICRSNGAYRDLIKSMGYDLSLDDEEYEEFILLINKLVDDIVKEYINNPSEVLNNRKTGYIGLLSSSIDYCPQFSLYDTQNYTLEKYVKKQVFNKIKQLFLGNPDDNNLKELYYKIRNYELNPVNIYSTEYINEIITKELSEMNNNFNRKNK